jgi:heptosyltransferase-1
MKQTNYSHIAILKLSSLGDIIHTLPAFSFLRKRFPDAEISWIAAPAGAKLLENFRGIDEIIVVDLKSPSLVNKPGEVKRIISKYGGKFDIILDFQGLLKSAVLAYLLKSYTVGFHKKNLREPLSRFCYDKKAGIFDENRHVILKNIHLARITVNNDNSTSHPDLTIEYPALKEARFSESAEKFLAENKLTEKNFSILNVGGGWQTKLLDISQYIAISEGLQEKRIIGSKIVVLWGNDKEQEKAAVISRATGAIMPIFFDCRDLIRFIRQARLIISADSLPLHIADMVGVPSVGLFGPTSPARNGSLLAESAAIYENLPCNFCYKKKCGTMECTKNLKIENIIRAVVKIDEKLN